MTLEEGGKTGLDLIALDAEKCKEVNRRYEDNYLLYDPYENRSYINC